jgi:hypothetical protein
MKITYFLVTFFLLGVTKAEAEPWEKVIPAVEERAAFHLSEAERLGYSGTTTDDVNFLDFYRENHECGILGRMLGLSDFVADYERLDVPRIADDLTNQEVIKLHAAGRTLEAWLDQAKRAVEQTKSERVQRWNDTCSGSQVFDYAPLLLLADVPGFESFPTSETNEPTSSAIMPEFDGRDEWARLFRTRIRDSLAEGPNFNAHYSFITFGCGAFCIMGFIADTRTGKVFELPFGGEATPELEIDFVSGSNLIHVIHMGQTSAECSVKAWSFDGESFKLEGEDTFVREEGCNIGQKIVSK